jgi:hypothetical protein
MGGWLALSQRGLSPLKKRQASLGASAAAGLRSVTQLDPCAAKTKTGNKKVLDQAVGWMRLLGRPYGCDQPLSGYRMTE